ncbi:GNAT family N-acetyltransferase [Frigidibacter sp. MR17.14]|uniref:GNAT family N-acetyltransferase n=1 Tax=Frigidibacter sp. MR17.14 TaxID=3126509 RepID=UPI00301303E0
MAFVEIRAATPQDATILARLHVAAWRETYATLLPAEVARLDPARRRERWRAILEAEISGRAGGAATQLLLADGLPAGFVTAGPQRHPPLAEMGYDGEIRALYLLRRWQGQGFGRRLIGAGAVTLARLGAWAASAQVLASNQPAGAFYAHLGARLVARLGGGARAEATWAWEDLQVLLPDALRQGAVPPYGGNAPG